MIAKVVLDTNIIIASLSTKSRYRIIIDKLLDKAFILVVTTEILLEYEEKIREKLAKINDLEILDKGEKLSSIITVKVPKWKPNEFMEALRTRNINTSISHKGFAFIDFESKGVDWALRISPHYYNNEEEVDILINTLKELRVS